MSCKFFFGVWQQVGFAFAPDAPQKPLVRKRACSRGVRWVQVHEPGSRAKRLVLPVHSNLYAPTGSTTFLATYIDVDVEKNVKQPHWHKYTRKRGHKTTYFGFCTTSTYHGELLKVWPRTKQTS